jgi:glycosyltransferase involved in cell wall biosynthesis
VEEGDLLKKLPEGIRIERTGYLDLMQWENNVARWLRGSPETANGHKSAGENGHGTNSTVLMRRAAELVRSTLYFPDHTIGWVPYGLGRALRLRRRGRWDLVYTTSPPRAAPVIGWLLKEVWGAPWVMEFMDPWYPPRGRWRGRAETKAQASLVKKADRVVVMTEGHARELEEKFRMSPHRVKVVRNGFFEEDFVFSPEEHDRLLDPEHVHFCHFGTIYSGNDGLFFQALAQLLAEEPIWRNRLRVHLVGAATAEANQAAKEYGLADVVQAHGFLPERSRMLRMMCESDCLLLFWGRKDFSRLAIAGKTYDYLRAGRPILAVTHEGGVKELVEHARAGRAVRPDDVEAMKQAVRAVMDGRTKANTRAPRQAEYVSQFRWERQAEILARTFEEALEDAH